VIYDNDYICPNHRESLIKQVQHLKLSGIPSDVIAVQDQYEGMDVWLLLKDF
jgi:hypothetical protein